MHIPVQNTHASLLVVAGGGGLLWDLYTLTGFISLTAVLLAQNACAGAAVGRGPRFARPGNQLCRAREKTDERLSEDLDRRSPPRSGERLKGVNSRERKDSPDHFCSVARYATSSSMRARTLRRTVAEPTSPGGPPADLPGDLPDDLSAIRDPACGQRDAVKTI